MFGIKGEKIPHTKHEVRQQARKQKQIKGQGRLLDFLAEDEEDLMVAF